MNKCQVNVFDIEDLANGNFSFAFFLKRLKSVVFSCRGSHRDVIHIYIDCWSKLIVRSIVLVEVYDDY